MRGIRVVLSLVLVVGWLLPDGGLGAQTTVAESPRLVRTPGQNQVHFLTYNLGGGCGGCTGTGIQKADELLSVALAAPRFPMAISTQETCSHSSYIELRDWLAISGYRAHYYATEVAHPGHPVCGSSSYPYRWFGNAAFWLGGCYGGSVSTCTSTSQFPASAQVGGEHSGYACARAAFPAYVVCSAHMTSSSDPIATMQSDHYYAGAAYLNLFASTVASGDFNLEPHQDTEFEFHNPPWREANCVLFTAPCPTHDAFVTIDYIYSSMCRTWNGNVYATNHSDHHVLQGYFSGAC